MPSLVLKFNKLYLLSKRLQTYPKIRHYLCGLSIVFLIWGEFLRSGRLKSTKIFIYMYFFANFQNGTLS